MGCDIHGTIEVKQSDLGGGDGLWYAVVKLDLLLRRNYDAFAHLFGVRYYEGEHEIEAKGYDGYMEPKRLYEGRGFPHDAADTTRREHDEWGGDAHSETFAYHSEVAGALKGADIPGEGWNRAVEMSGILADHYGADDYLDGEVRWVVWFDN